MASNMTNDKPPAVDIVAAREHSVTSRRTRVHVIVCHDLNARSHSLYEMFRFADRVSPEVLEALTRDLAADILQDADVLIAELQGIKAFAERQMAKLPTPLRE
jgi:hypothetical protein